MYSKPINIYLYTIKFVPKYHKTQEIGDKVVNTCFLTIVWQHKKIIPNWFVTSKMLEKFHDSVLANYDMFFFEEYFSKVTFFGNKMSIFSVDRDKTDLGDDNNFHEDGPETIIHVRILTYCNKFEKRKELKKRYKQK